MKDNENSQITASLATLARHISETPRDEIAALRAIFEEHISSIEARLETRTYQPAIDATVKIISKVIGERVVHAREHADTAVTQALAANTMLRQALENAQEQLESARTALAAAEGDRKAVAAQCRDAVSEKKKLVSALDKSEAQLHDLQARLKSSQQEADELAAERAELQRQLKDATAAKNVVETQYQQLVAASQKLTDGLSRTLHGQREQHRPVTAPAPKRSESVESRTPSTAPPPAAAASAKKKPLQFPHPARDTVRVKIRRGTYVSVDGIPGELVDLSIGGAQAVLRQLVKPNQLVRLTLPTPAGQLTCKGRIVWVLYEQPGTSLSVYRMGVKFIDSDARAVEYFMKDYRDDSLTTPQHSSEIA